jgi:hypothetical protein
VFFGEISLRKAAIENLCTYLVISEGIGTATVDEGSGREKTF